MLIKVKLQVGYRNASRGLASGVRISLQKENKGLRIRNCKNAVIAGPLEHLTLNTMCAFRTGTH